MFFATSSASGLIRRWTKKAQNQKTCRLIAFVPIHTLSFSISISNGRMHFPSHHKRKNSLPGVDFQNGASLFLLKRTLYILSR
ncbi:hypothetical protein, partial [uncultured Dubosiella sp.]|uniref:hypothetical protein n=1 Tax=uncultured Dubosiella sp. TaxID=1937011 RepID=UPI0027317E7A